MKSRILSAAVFALSTVFASASVATAQEPKESDYASDWRPLFNGKNLQGWHTFLQKHGRDSDPDRVITIEDGAIHLYKDAKAGSEVVMGYISTDKDYGDYHFRCQYRWGDKKFQPRLALKKDAGLYYHIIGEDAVWPRSLQCQIQEGDVGDLLALYGVQVDTWIDPATRSAKQKTFQDPSEGGEPVTLGGEGIGYQSKRGAYEIPGWNTLEILVSGQTSEHRLNGKLVNRCRDIRVLDPKTKQAKPLFVGRIALEIEAAEMFYRDVEIRDFKPQATAAKGEAK